MRSTLLPLIAVLALVACGTEEDYATFYRGIDEDGDGATSTLDCEPENDQVHDHEWYQDNDGDGHGDPDTRVDTCDPPAEGGPWVSVGDDCNDADAAVSHPSTGFPDGDGDGFGRGLLLVTRCDGGAALAEETGDCEDGDPDVNPGAEPVCGNAKDDDCDGLPDCEPADGELEASDADARYQGAGEEALGASLAAADIDGDGIDDVIVGAPDDMGAAYVVPGPFTGELDVDDEASVRLTGTEGSAAGTALTGLGDIDGDGYDDVLVGAPGGDEAMAVLVYGPVRALDDGGEPELSTVSRDMVELGLKVTGSFELGAALAAPGDLLGGDGEDDVVVAAPGTSSVYVVQGPLSTDVKLGEGVADVALIDGVTGLDLGASVATIQDLDGDGRAELALGAPGYISSFREPFHGEAGEGAVYVFFEAGNVEVDDADCVIVGEESGGGVGESVADAGDVDGDGLGDLMVGAPLAEEQAGAVWLFTGAVLSESPAPSLDDREAYFYGSQDMERAGLSMLGRVDLDQDGNQDLLIGSPKAQWGRSGATAGGVGVWYGPISGRHNSENADALILAEDLGDDAQSLFGWSMVVTRTNDLIIGAPGVGAVVDETDDGGEPSFGDGVVYTFHLGW